MKCWLTCCCLWITGLLQAQVMTADQFIDRVKQYHPLAKQASLVVAKAQADLLSAKGGFDPVFKLDASRKTFNGTNYYHYTNPELVVPTPIGIDIKAGTENNGGSLINTELSPGQSSYLGIEMPVARGLLLDKRRAILQQAKQLTLQSEQERRELLNNLLFDAYQAYWQWTGYYQLYRLYSQYLQLAGDRYRLVRIAYANGDRAAVDTLEALVQVQQFQLMQADAQLRYANASLDLSNYWWNETDSAVLLPPTVLPDTVQFALYQLPEAAGMAMNDVWQMNPQLNAYQYKIKTLEIERRLKFQQLLPIVNLKANVLNKGYNVFKGFDGALLQNNYKWGIDVKFPLFLREGRGEYKKAGLKMQEANYDLLAKKRMVATKVSSYLNEVSVLKQQMALTMQTVVNYQQLLKAEYQRFSNGESTLFMVNTRENKLIEQTEKMIALRMKYMKARYATDWAAGILR